MTYWQWPEGWEGATYEDCSSGWSQGHILFVTNPLSLPSIFHKLRSIQHSLESETPNLKQDYY